MRQLLTLALFQRCSAIAPCSSVREWLHKEHHNVSYDEWAPDCVSAKKQKERSETRREVVHNNMARKDVWTRACTWVYCVLAKKKKCSKNRREVALTFAPRCRYKGHASECCHRDEDYFMSILLVPCRVLRMSICLWTECCFRLTKADLLKKPTKLVAFYTLWSTASAAEVLAPYLQFTHVTSKDHKPPLTKGSQNVLFS